MNSETAFEPVRSERALGPWVFAQEGWRWLEREVLPRWVPMQRWFGGKARTVASLVIEATVPVGGEAAQILVLRVNYSAGEPERYAVPLAIGAGNKGVIATGADRSVVLHDAIYDSAFRSALLDAMRQRASGSLRGESSALLDATGEPGESRVLHAEQSNTSIIYGGRLFLKLFRRLQAGINPDAEISRYLGTRRFPHTPPFGGALDLCVGEETMPLALLLGCVENEGDAWAWALGELGGHFSRGTPVRLERIALLGQRTAEMHLALAQGEGIDFASEPLTADDFAALAQSTSTRMGHVFTALRARAGDELSAAVLAREEEARARIAKLASAPPAAVKTRHHGDYHLGQVLATRDDWMIIDFEGEPLRSLPERRAKRSPLRDVAGMLRSFHYAAHAARPETVPVEVAEKWSETACGAFLDRYLAVAAGAPFLPAGAADRDALLAAFVLEKVLYEIDYELNNRPAWLPIPLRGFLRVMG